jgi:hypothetical protein
MKCKWTYYKDKDGDLWRIDYTEMITDIYSNNKWDDSDVNTQEEIDMYINDWKLKEITEGEALLELL